MGKVVFNAVKNEDEERYEYIRRTRTICMYPGDRPQGIYSKSLVKVKVANPQDDKTVEGVFCIDSKGSKKGQLLAHHSHFKGIAAGSVVDIDIKPAAPVDYVEWLQQNDDPERKALGEILNFALTGAEDAKTARTASEENLDAAQRDRSVAAHDRQRGVFYGIAGFIGGIVFDIGMLEEKLGIKFPLVLIIMLFLIVVYAIFRGFRPERTT
ncbi:hypothetical protein [Rhizobium paknamense]|uniref:Uncharacterized protein n=1 Tax=Rhizobium paknamense TaxID=1206817 RepID=A0ABU0IA94_9HYPH|nr:hypothetical protein [Rhizobium paknamense]MDQ0455142.1 hypothetical protein [Rhizobium paknamense]